MIPSQPQYIAQRVVHRDSHVRGRHSPSPRQDELLQYSDGPHSAFDEQPPTAASAGRGQPPPSLGSKQRPLVRQHRCPAAQVAPRQCSASKRATSGPPSPAALTTSEHPPSPDSNTRPATRRIAAARRDREGILFTASLRRAIGLPTGALDEQLRLERKIRPRRLRKNGRRRTVGDGDRRDHHLGRTLGLCERPPFDRSGADRGVAGHVEQPESERRLQAGQLRRNRAAHLRRPTPVDRILRKRRAALRQLGTCLVLRRLRSKGWPDARRRRARGSARWHGFSREGALSPKVRKFRADFGHGGARAQQLRPDAFGRFGPGRCRLRTRTRDGRRSRRRPLKQDNARRAAKNAGQNQAKIAPGAHGVRTSAPLIAETPWRPGSMKKMLL